MFMLARMVGDKGPDRPTSYGSKPMPEGITGPR